MLTVGTKAILKEKLQLLRRLTQLVLPDLF